MAEAAPWEDFQDAPPWMDYASAPTVNADTDLPLPRKVTKAEDIKRAAGSQGYRSFVRLPGMAGDVAHLVGDTAANFANKAFGDPKDWGVNKWLEQNLQPEPMLRDNPALQGDVGRRVATSADVEKTFDTATGLKAYQPKTTEGKIAGVVASAAPAALGAPSVVSGGLRILGTAGGAELGKDFAGYLADLLGGEGGATPEDKQLSEQWGGMAGGALGYGAGMKTGDALADALGKTGVAKGVRSAAQTAWDYGPGRIQVIPPNPNQLSMSIPGGPGGGGLRIGPPPPPRGPEPVPINKRLADRADMTAQSFEDWYAKNQQHGIEPLEGEAYQAPGIDRWSAITRLPGTSGTHARDAILGSIDDPQETGAKYQLQSQALNALDKLTGGEKVLADKLEAAQQAYTPVLTDSAVSPALEAKAMKIAGRIGLDNLKDIAADATELAQSRGLTKLNKAQQLQYLKQQIYNRAQKLLADPERQSLGASYMQIWSELRDLLHGDEGIPGYAEIDKAYETVAKQKALDDSLRGAIMRGKEGKNPGYVGMSLKDQQALREAFGSAADEFIIGQRMTDRRATDLTAVLPGSNSTTMKNAAHAADNAIEHMHGMASAPVKHTIGTALDSMLGGLAEKHRDAQGAQFAKRLTPERAAEIAAQLKKLEAEKQAAALAQALAASQGAKPKPDQQAQ